MDRFKGLADRVIAIPTQVVTDEQGHVGDDNQLDVLAAAGDVERVAQDGVELQVVIARRAGYSWAEVGTALGVSRQSAWERWHDWMPCDMSRSIDVDAAKNVG